MLYNAVVSGIRTGVAALVGLALTWLIARGVSLPEGTDIALSTTLFAVFTAGYNTLVNWLALKVHPSFGYLLGIPKTPEYNAVVAETGGELVATKASSLPTGEVVTVNAVPVTTEEGQTDAAH